MSGSEMHEASGVASGPGSQATPEAPVSAGSSPSVSIPNAHGKTLKESLARYLNPEVFREGVPDRVKHTCKEQGRVVHDRLKFRRQLAMKHAEAAIRFFSRPENREWLDRRASAMSAGTAETAQQAQGRSPASPVPKADAQGEQP